MPVSKALLNHIAHCLTIHYNGIVNINAVEPVSGGDINLAYCLHTSAGKLMMKLNSKIKFTGMFQRELEGLAAIRQTQTIAVPSVVLQGDFETESFLLMEWIEAKRPDANSSVTLGKHLAAMHRHTHQKFGFATNNYMGSLPQSNRYHATWAGFFVEERLQPMVHIAVDKQLLPLQDVKQFEKLYAKLPGLFDEEPPALLHGDLWGGNYLISTEGTPYLIDPAVSYGNREFDIAMTSLFGGFNKEFYEAYLQDFPLKHNWQQRLDLWNLYPLLLHLNLFGLGYIRQVKQCLQKYI